MSYADFYRRSIEDRDGFWAEQATLIDWQVLPSQICDTSRPPFVRWFPGARTNLCHNAVDRHLETRGNQPALIFVSTETGERRVYSFRELHDEVRRASLMLLSLGVGQGDRVLIYMPMIPEAVFSMLACARIGAIHCVVFGGFASASLASRIDDARPKLIVSADAGSRGGKVVPYKPLLDEAIRVAQYRPGAVLMVDRGLAPMELVPVRDYQWEMLATTCSENDIPCTWLESTEPSYILYTSGTTGRPKGVQRDTGGYAVALAASMKYIFKGEPGSTFFCTSDIGWVVGHSYIVYGPLLAGMATLLYEGLPVRPDPAIWWELVETYKVTTMFSSPTALRVLRQQDSAYIKRHQLLSLKALFLAGEPLDEPTACWIGSTLDVPIVDNYWQTESGWPILTLANGVESQTSKLGSPGVPMYGYDVKLVNDVTGEEITEPGRKGVVVIVGPTPPGFMQTVWQDDERYVKTYWGSVPGLQAYSTFDWATRDVDGYFTILGRTDDVINVAGHRLGTREIEESILSHPAVAEVAVIGVADSLKGQVAVAFCVRRELSVLDESAFEAEVAAQVQTQLGSVARPARVYVVPMLPKTRSGKLLRRAIQAVCEGRDPGDLTTIEDPAALAFIRALSKSAQ